ncbi:fimbria/pilus periplasmic chaperone [Gilvimarinus xylanilyticus]|uniref:Fimbria/pilus periplasmic chaperone n=1 Tax=Gilvimarinus xylanilyticus TaxID=2944139 RepID=A0A9X2HVY2_9GAMM|nr:fimbria/pilus periplasmic chaperone [Gilvimarinus xylanilyticus]MCP8898669.1 fimbria/pilus periplasmic chaperone [Gilvimarinus xylanilyticus]
MIQRLGSVHLFICLLFAFAASESESYSVSPLRTELQPLGSGAVQRLTITNTETKPITLSLNPEKITIDSDGRVIKTPANNDIQVFPPQVILEAGQKQSIQIRYTGDTDIISSLYTVHVNQVPVLAAKGKAQIKVALDFHVAVLVQPHGGTPKFSVEEITQDTSTGLWRINIANRGDAAGRFNWGEWIAQTDKGELIIPVNNLETGDSGYLLPGSNRWVSVTENTPSQFSELYSLSFNPTKFLENR